MNKIEKKKYNAERYILKKEEILRQSIEWSKNNPEKIKIHRKRRYENGGKEYILTWSKNNPEKRKAMKKRWVEKNPLGSWISNRIASWRAKDKQSDLTTDYLVDLFKSQKGKCYYTDQELLLHAGKVRPCTASLDRLVPSDGYIKGNVVWCAFFVNTMKGGLSEQEFYSFIKKILIHKEKLCE